MKRVIFIHRSVGENLIKDGGAYRLLDGHSDKLYFCDFNQNTGVLRDNSGAKKTAYDMPGGDTHPSNYAELFSERYSSDFKDFVMSHDTVVIKSCYPNSNIKDDAELDKIKREYTAIAGFFVDKPEKRLIIMTSPPLRPTSTTSANAARAGRLADWLNSTELPKNVSIFDFFHLLANSDNYLKKEYRRLIWLDNHPNRKASKDVVRNLIEHVRTVCSYG